jgi:hypothetical protein
MIGFGPECHLLKLCLPLIEFVAQLEVQLGLSPIRMQLMLPCLSLFISKVIT